MKHFSKLCIGSLGILASLNSVEAQVNTWTGGGNNANWKTAGNWTQGEPASGANVLFSGSTRPNVNVNGTPNPLNSLTFNPTANFTLTGNPLTIGAGGIVNSAQNNAINVTTLSLSAGQTWYANSGSLSLGGANLNLGANSLTLDGVNNFSIGNAIGGTGSITKNGNGEATLTGANTYSGGTTVSGGTLRVRNTTGSATGSGAVTVSSGARLTGDGSISGAVTMQGGSTLAAGNNGTGTITTGGLTLNPNATLDVEINQATGTAGSATGWDKIVAPTLTLNATAANPIIINLTSLSIGGGLGALADFDNTQGYSWLIAETTGGIFNFDASAFDVQLGNFANDTGMGDFNVFSDGQNLFLNFTPVPEPSTVAFGAMGGALLLASVLRRKKK